MMDDFKKHLSDYGIEFTEKVFASADSISGLGADPFVSDWHFDSVIPFMAGSIHKGISIPFLSKSCSVYLPNIRILRQGYSYGQCTVLMLEHSPAR